MCKAVCVWNFFPGLHVGQACARPICPNRYGAFHGAEVPFVFGFASEINSSAEETLSTSIGCYWSNFAHTGDPNEGPCKQAAAWPAYRAPGSNSSVHPTNTLLLDTTDTGSGIQVRQNSRADKCALLMPLRDEIASR